MKSLEKLQVYLNPNADEKSLVLRPKTAEIFTKICGTGEPNFDPSI